MFPEGGVYTGEMKDGLPVFKCCHHSMVLEQLNLIMGLYLRVTLKMVRRMVMESLDGMTILIMMENFEMTLLKAMVSIIGLMENGTKDSGFRVR